MYNENSTYWQYKIICSLVFGYACYYLVRQNYIIVLSDKDLSVNISYQYIGWAFTINAGVYGLGKIINGYLSDRLSSKIFFSLGLFISGTLSLAASFFDSIIILCYIYVINGWFQSMGFPAIAKLIVNWIPRDKIASKWSIVSCAPQIGVVVIMLTGSYLLNTYGWQYTLLVPGIGAIMVSFILFNTIKNSPVKGGFGLVANNGEANPTSLKYLWVKFLQEREIQLLCLANLLSYAVRMGTFYWTPIFLIQHQDFSSLIMGIQVGLYETMVLIGSVSVGYIIDRFFPFSVSMVGVMYMLIFIILLCLLWKVTGQNQWANMIIIGLVGFIINAPQIIIGVMSIKVFNKFDIGVLNGVIGFFGYIGTGIAGIGTGFIVSSYGWDGAIILLLLASCINLAIFLRLAYLELLDL